MSVRPLVFVAVALVSALLSGRPAAAQVPSLASAPSRSAVDSLVQVVIATPIYLLPDATRLPLRVAKEGSVLRVAPAGASATDWTYVQFADSDNERRFGYIQSKYVHAMAPPLPEAIDLSVPDAQPHQISPVGESVAAAQAPAPTQPTRSTVRTRAITPRRGRLDVDAVRFHAVDRAMQTFSLVQTLNREPAAEATAYPAQTLDVLDIGLSGGVGLTHGLGVSVHFDGEDYSNVVGLAINIPSPYFFNRNATAGSVTSSMLERHERAVDISAEYTIPSPSWLSVRVFGGPTYFHVTSQMVSDIAYTQVASAVIPINVVAITRFKQSDVTGSSLGFHVGADAAYFFSRHVGLGGGARFNRGTVTVLEPLSSQDADLRVGHLALTGGLRLRF